MITMKYEYWHQIVEVYPENDWDVKVGSCMTFSGRREDGYIPEYYDGELKETRKPFKVIYLGRIPQGLEPDERRKSLLDLIAAGKPKFEKFSSGVVVER